MSSEQRTPERMTSGNQPARDRDVVVTGLGVLSAIGRDADELRRRVFAGESGVGPIDGFDVAQSRTRLGAQIRSADFRAHADKREMRQLDRVSLLALVAAEQALADAGLDLVHHRDDLGISLGTGFGPSHSIEDSVRRLEQRRRPRPTTVLRVMLSSPAATLCERFQCRGPSHVHVTACAASAHALADAAAQIRRGDSELCLAGGCDAFPGEALFAIWNALEVMTPDDDGSRTPRPFSADRNGFVIGEAACFLVLESAERARARGARIRGILSGSGSCSHTPHVTRPSVEGMEDAMSLALRSAGTPPKEIAYVNAHGTATELNDVLETEALRRVFGPAATRLRISSTKAAHGHTMGAAGALEAAITLLALEQRQAPPTLHLQDADPRCDLDYTPLQARPFTGRAAMTNSFAFGGHYVSLVFERPDDASTADD